MASFINSIVTKFTAEGTDRTVSAIDGVTKAQTRQANASTSAGRLFAAQSKGLGGIVGAYAGAAANIIAITQAYEALSKAARIEQTIAGTKALASQIGESGTTIIANLKAITNGQLSVAQAAEVANTALSAGFDSKQLAGLTDVAFKASRVLGRDLSDSIQRVIRGTAKLEPELLDELGIFTRIEPAVEKYANKLGLTASSLTEFQRRQAFANSAIEEGQRKFGLIQISASSTQASFEKLGATFSDLAEKIGGIIAGALAPALDFLSKNTGITLLALAAVASIVFKTLLGQVGSFITGTVTGLQNLVNNVDLSKKQLLEFSKAAAEAQAAAGKTEGVGRFIGAGGVGSAGKEALERAKAGNVSKTQMATDIPVLTKAIAAEQAYQKNIESGNTKIKDKEAALANSRSRVEALTGTLGGYNKALAATGTTTQFLTGLTVGLSRAVGVLGVIIGGIGTILSGIGIAVAAIQLVGTLFDKDFLGAIYDGWNALREPARNLKAGIEGISVSIINASTDRLKGVFNTKELEELAKQTQDRLSNAISTTEEQLAFQKNKLALGLSRGANINPQAFKGLVKTVGNLDTGSVDDLNKQFESFGLTVETVSGRSQVRVKELKDGLDGLTTLRLVEQVADLANLQKQISEAPAGSKKLQELKIKLEAVKAAIEGIKSQAIVFAPAIAQVAKLADLPTTVVAESFKNLGQRINESTKEFYLGGVAIGTYENGAAKINDTYGVFAKNLTLTDKLQTDLTKSFESGNATSEGTSKILSGLITNQQELEKSTEALIASGVLRGAQEEAAKKLLADKAVAIENLKRVQDELLGAEKLARNLEKQFGTERQAFEEAIAKGLVDANGKIAKSDQEVTANRLEFLNLIIAKGGEAKEVLASGAFAPEDRSTLTKQAENYENAVKAAIGGSFKLVQESKKLNDDLDKRLLTLENESKELELQTALSNARLKISNALADAATKEADRQAYLKNVLEFQLKVAQTRIDLSETELKIANSRLSSEQALVEARGALAKAGSGLAIAKAERQGAAALGPLKAQEQVQQALPNLFSTDERFNLQVSIAKQEYDNNIKVINLRAQQTQAEFASRVKVLQLEDQKIANEIDQKQKQIEQTIKLQSTQGEIFENNSKSEISRLNLELSLATQRKSEILIASNLEAQKVNNARDGRLQELKIIEERIGIIKKEAEVFQKAINGNTEWVNGYIKAVNTQFGSRIQELTVQTNFEQVFKDIDKSRTSLDSIKDTINRNTEEELKNIEERKQADLNNFNASISQKQRELGLIEDRVRADRGLNEETRSAALRDLESQKAALEARRKVNEININAAKTEGATAAESAQAQIEAEKRVLDEKLRAAEIQRNAFLQLANEISGIIKSNLNKGVDSFFDAIKNGTLTLKTFKEGVVGVFRDILFDIAKAVTKELLIKPITDAIGSSLRSLVGGLFGPDAEKAVGGALAKGTASAAGDIAKTAAGSGGTCGCITDALSKAAPAVAQAAGAAAPAVAKVAEGAAPAVIQAATPAAAKLDLGTASNPLVVEGAKGAATGANTFGTLTGASASQAYAFGQAPGAANLTSPEALGAVGANVNMAPQGFQSTFGVPGSYAGNGLTSTGDYNTLTGTYTMAQQATPLPNINTSMQQPLQGMAFGNTGNAPGFDAGLTDTKVIEDFSSKIEEVTPRIDQLGTSFGNLDASAIKWGSSVDGAAGQTDLLAGKTNNLASSTEQMIPQVDQMGTVTGMVAQSQGVLAAATGTNTAATVTNTGATTLNTTAENLNSQAKGGGGGGGGLFSWIGSLFGFGQASGGIVQNNGAISRFAAGGGVMMRDSVPALLEPGEFVMKKSSVDSIGRSAMERMNATGKSSGGVTNVKVQVDNSGQPKEAQQGETQIDGETAIVKLILKDLNSNGPIRRSIRGNT